MDNVNSNNNMVDLKENNLNVTNIMDLQNYAQGTIVRLPDFAENQPFVARLRRPSLLVMAKSGKIPNTLLNTANDMFTGNVGNNKKDSQYTLADIYDVCKIVCEASLISPTLQEIESAGLNLSDEQIMAIFNYAQSGVKALDSFR